MAAAAGRRRPQGFTEATQISPKLTPKKRLKKDTPEGPGTKKRKRDSDVEGKVKVKVFPGTSAFDVEELELLLKELNKLTHKRKGVTAYYVDMDGVVQASCQPEHFETMVTQFRRYHHTYGKVNLCLTGEDVEVITETEPKWRLSAISETRTQSQIEGGGTPGLPVIVKPMEKAGRKKKALMGCCHVVSDLLKNMEKEDTSNWLEKDGPRNIQLAKSTFTVHSFCTPECKGTPSRLGQRAEGFVGENADVALVYLDHPDAVDDIPTEIIDQQSPYKIPSLREYKSMSSKTVSKRGGRTGFTQGKIIGFGGVTDIQESKSSSVKRQFVNLIQVACDNKSDHFSEPGDSGAPVYIKDETTWKLLGVVAAGKNTGKFGKITLVIPIHHQIECLKEKLRVDVKVADVHASYPSRFRY